MKRKGQAMILGLFFLLPTTLLVSMIFNMALLTEHRQQLQNAADRSAAAGALLKADLVSSLAWINIALADLHAQATNHAVNTAIVGTLAEIENWGLQGVQNEYPADVNLWATLVGAPTSFPPPADSIGGSGAIARYQSIYNTASVELAKCELWQDRLGAMQANIASLAQELIKREVFRTALVNMGVEGTESVDGQIHINLFPYRAWFTPAGLAFESWLITQTAGGGWTLENGTDSFQVSISDEAYTVQMNSSANSFLYKLSFVNENQFDFNGLDFNWNEASQAWSVPELDLSFGIGPNGGTLVQYKGNSMELRRDPFTGTLEIWQNGDWAQAPDNLNIGGLDIPAGNGSVSIQAGQGDTFTFNIGQGKNLSFNGTTSQGTVVTFNFNPETENFSINGPISPLTRVNLQAKGKFEINGFEVPDDATGQWHLKDTLRDRLSQEGPSQWVYEISTQGGYTRVENNGARFGVDQSQGIFGPLFGSQGVNSTWLYDSRSDGPGWYNPGTGGLAATSLDSDQHYHRTVPCWHPLDINCPAHNNCPGNPSGGFSSLVDGGWHYPVTEAWVDCYLCDRRDADGDGQSDVRRYPESNINNPSSSISNSLLRAPGDKTHWDIKIPTHLVLTEEFFRWGINVAVHSFENPWDNFLLGSFFTQLNWSPIATASARVGFVDPDTDRLIFRFDTPEDTQDWVDNSVWNLTITQWVAMMTSTRTQIRLPELELQDTLLTSIPTGDSGGVALLKHFLGNDAQWRRRWDDANPSGNASSAAAGANRQGENWNYNDVEIDRWIKH